MILIEPRKLENARVVWFHNTSNKDNSNIPKSETMQPWTGKLFEKTWLKSKFQQILKKFGAIKVKS